jgi:hypothetical protein
MRTSIKAVLVAVAFTSATISLSANAYTVIGAGGQSCESWMSEKEKNSLSYLIYQTWVLGFVSGAGGGLGEKYEVDADGAIGWIDNYCQTNPLSNIAYAAQELVLELRE